MSMPSSRLLVATTAGRRPDFSSSSMVARCSLLTEPWCARASTAGAPADCPDWAITWAGLCRRAAGRGGGAVGADGVRAVGRLDPLLPDLVEPGGQPLGEAAAVGEDERGGVLGDEVDDALLDVRPDARPLLLPGRGAGEVAGGLAELGHVGDRDDDLEVPLLGRRRLHDLDRADRRRGSGPPPRPGGPWRTGRSAGRDGRGGRRGARGSGRGGRRAWCRRGRAPRRG